MLKQQPLKMHRLCLLLLLCGCLVAPTGNAQPLWSLQAGLPLARIVNNDDASSLKLNNKTALGYSLGGGLHWRSGNDRWEWSAGLSLDGYRALQQYEGAPNASFSKKEHRIQTRLLYAGLPLSVSFSFIRRKHNDFRFFMGAQPSLLLSSKRVETASYRDYMSSSGSWVWCEDEITINDKKFRRDGRFSALNAAQDGPGDFLSQFSTSGSLPDRPYAAVTTFVFVGLGYRHAVSETLSMDFSCSLGSSVNDFEQKKESLGTAWSSRSRSWLIVPAFSIGVYKALVK
jgi:hypothetical protein